MRLTPRSPSRSGAGEPEVTKAAVVSGTRPAARRRSKDQWYEPCDLDGGGKVVGSFTVPLYIAKKSGKLSRCWGRESGNVRPPGT